MSNDKQFKDFYTLELKILEENEKQRLAAINARKNMNKSKTSSSTYNRRNIISKERLIIVVTVFILSLLLFPIAQNYLIKSNISKRLLN
ncbi:MULTISPECIES: hypothetical protein [unclassified Francisella]|uniref:hypothetical protein n=1 Tax=unclassified Francisella TaxID=2610885 RepID=UPI002E30F3AF|nr:MULTISPECIES: hypothetical protein [unclassified Francisella]MED7820161.1 hypothetical protein [Francisella sp. 19S2-4]MED7830991.1 hypothetical protein [Francisella sp. 19S2-10]